MADNGLTRDQNEQLDFVCKIEDDAIVSRMSANQLKTYKDLLTARDQLEAEFIRLNQEAKAYEQPKPEEPKAPEPVAEAVIQEQPAQESPAPVEPDIPETTVDPAQVEYWKNRYKELQSSVSPLQQKAATMRKQLDKKDDGVDEVKAELAELKKLILETRLAATPAPAPAFDATAGLEETDPDLARRLAALKQELLSQIQQPNDEVQSLKKRIAELSERDEQAKFNSFKAEHDATVRSLQPDFFALLNDQQHVKEFNEWIAKQAPVVQDIMLNPYGHTPMDISYVVDQFKKSKRSSPTAKKPSLGDLAAKTGLSPLTPLMETPNAGPGLLSDSEFKNIERLIEAEAKKGRNGDPEGLLARYEATIAHRNNISTNRRTA